MNPFILDSNFFIQAHRAHYPFDVVPSFWAKIVEMAQGNMILSIDKVKNEIFRNDDELTTWCLTNLPDDFFKDSSAAIIEYGRIAQWANLRNDHYKQRAIQEFLNTEEADAWLVAYAIHSECPLLSHEKSEPFRRNRIKIPDVCNVFEVSYHTTVEMFRILNQTF